MDANDCDILPADMVQNAIPLVPSLLFPVKSTTNSYTPLLQPQPPPGGAERVGGPPRRPRRQGRSESAVTPVAPETPIVTRKPPVPTVADAAKRKQQQKMKNAAQEAEPMENQDPEAGEPKFSWRAKSEERQHKIQLLQEENRRAREKRERREMRKREQERERQRSVCSDNESCDKGTAAVNDSRHLAWRAAKLEDEVMEIDRMIAEAEYNRQQAISQAAVANEKMAVADQKMVEIARSRNVSRANASFSRTSTPVMSTADTLPESIASAADTAADRVREWKRKMTEQMKRAAQEEAEELSQRRGRRMPEDPNVYDGKSLCVWCGDVAGPGHDQFCVLRPAKCRFCGMKLAAVMQSQHEVTCPERTDDLVQVCNVSPPSRPRHSRRSIAQRDLPDALANVVNSYASGPRRVIRPGQLSRCGSSTSQISRSGSAASIRSTSSRSSKRHYRPGPETSRRSKAATPQRRIRVPESPRRFQPQAPQRPQAETPRRRPQPRPQQNHAQSPQRTPRQTPRGCRRLKPLDAPIAPAAAPNGHWGIPPGLQQHAAPPSGYNHSTPSGCKLRPAGGLTPRRAMPTHLPPVEAPAPPCRASPARGRAGRPDAGSTASSRATTPRLSRPGPPAQARVQATPRGRGRQARQVPAESPHMHRECISQKLSGATSIAPTAHKGIAPSADACAHVPTKEELRIQMQREREEFIQRRRAQDSLLRDSAITSN